MAEVLTIEELRSRIDVIDDQLVRLLNVRVACAVEVGRLKHEAGVPIYQPDREAQVLAGVRKSATDLAGPLTAEAVGQTLLEDQPYGGAHGRGEVGRDRHRLAARRPILDAAAP